MKYQMKIAVVGLSLLLLGACKSKQEADEADRFKTTPQSIENFKAASAHVWKSECNFLFTDTGSSYLKVDMNANGTLTVTTFTFPNTKDCTTSINDPIIISNPEPKAFTYHVGETPLKNEAIINAQSVEAINKGGRTNLDIHIILFDDGISATAQILSGQIMYGDQPKVLTGALLKSAKLRFTQKL